MFQSGKPHQMIWKFKGRWTLISQVQILHHKDVQVFTSSFLFSNMQHTNETRANVALWLTRTHPSAASGTYGHKYRFRAFCGGTWDNNEKKTAEDGRTSGIPHKVYDLSVCWSRRLIGLFWKIIVFRINSWQGMVVLTKWKRNIRDCLCRGRVLHWKDLLDVDL